jgi:hypothetical protein
MGRYHALFYTVFTIAGIAYLITAFFLGILSSTFPTANFLVQYMAMAPGLILYLLTLMIVSAIIIMGARKVYANFLAWSEKI